MAPDLFFDLCSLCTMHLVILLGSALLLNSDWLNFKLPCSLPPQNGSKHYYYIGVCRDEGNFSRWRPIWKFSNAYIFALLLPMAL